MRLKLLLLLLSIIIPAGNLLISGNVSIEKAYTVAVNFHTSKQLRSSDKEIKLIYTSIAPTLRTSSGEPAVYYYVFSANNNSGFVVVAGDDVAKPLLGYSLSGNYDPANLPPAFVYWMEGLQNEIDNALTQRLASDEKTLAEWDAFVSGNLATLRTTQSVAPLVTTTWAQGSPFNRQCPLYGTTRSIAGCVAVAMSQIMKYHNYPPKGTGIIPAYKTSRGTSIPAVNLDADTGYDWANMTNSYTSSSSEAAISAVSKLVYHTATSVSMDFDLTESGAVMFYPAVAWPAYFRYDQSVQTKLQYFYTSDEWNTLLKNELNAGRPLIYFGTTTQNGEGGHEFVCDGYDDYGKYHFNWGWGGSYDGYYSLNALNPGEHTYNNNQGVILNIQPNRNLPKTYEMKQEERTNLLSTKTSVSKGEIFSVNSSFQNAGSTDFVGDYGFALTGNDGNILEIIGTVIPLGNFLLPDTLPAMSYYTWLPDAVCAVSNAVPPGSYRLKPAVKPVDGDWFVIDGKPGTVDELLINVSSSFTPDNSKLYLFWLPADNAQHGFSVDQLMHGLPASFEFCVYNGGSIFVGDLELGLYDNNGQLIQLIDKRRIDLDHTYFIRSLFYSPKITAPPGSYLLKLFVRHLDGNLELLPSFDSSKYQNEMPVTVGQGTNVNELSVQQLRVYPNPVRDVLFVSDERSALRLITITDLSGRTLKTLAVSNEHQATIPVTDLPAGIYLVSIQTEQGFETRKVIIN
jgi:hypothetical protein